MVRIPGDDRSGAIICIEESYDALGGAYELIKYPVKDITSDGEKIPAELYAGVYKALDGRRITQSSSGFMARAERAAQRCDCGTALPFKIQRRRLTASRDGEPAP